MFRIYLYTYAFGHSLTHKFNFKAAKIRLSERNTKEKHVFLFISEQKYLRPQVKDTH